MGAGMGKRSLEAAFVAALLLAAVLVGSMSPAAAGATVVTVSVTADVVDGNTTPGNISLREAVDISNADGVENAIVLGGDQSYALTDCASSGNEDEDANANGDLDLLDGEDIQIFGNGSTIEQTCDSERVVDKLGTGTLVLDEVTITGGTPSDGDGGGVLVGVGLTVRNGSVLRDNTAFNGNGGGAHAGGLLTVQDSSVHDNTTVSGGGGGLASLLGVTLERSAVNDNRSYTGAGAISGGTTVIVRNSTVSHNLAENQGGITATHITLEYATVVGNSGRQGFQTDNLAGGLSITAFASIIGLGGPSEDCSAANFFSNGYNLGYDASCELDHPTDLPGTYPHLNGAGVDDGGPLSHPAVVPSRAIDRIPAACGAAANDQWDTARPIGGSCDVGAREVAPVACGGTFTDVGPGHPFGDEICWMGQTAISTGFLDQTFKPGAPVTRQSMAAFIYRLAMEPPYDPGFDQTFNDVTPSHPFFQEIEWMAATGIASGFDGDLFLPGANVSRQAMSAFMYRVAGEPSFFPAGQTFTDVSPAHPFYQEIGWMADEEISTGYSDDTYRPSIPVSRQAMAAFMLRLAESVPLDGL
jgi:hypothetical protein